MTAPRRSAGDRHCKRALSGTKSSPLKIPDSAMSRIVPSQAGADRGKRQRADGQPQRTQWQQAVFHLRRRQLARQQASERRRRSRAQPERHARLQPCEVPTSLRRKPGSAAEPAWRSSRPKSDRSASARSTRSARIELHARRTVVPRPPAARAALTRGIVSDASSPSAARADRIRPPARSVHRPVSE